MEDSLGSPDKRTCPSTWSPDECNRVPDQGLGLSCGNTQDQNSQQKVCEKLDCSQEGKNSGATGISSLEGSVVVLVPFGHKTYCNATSAEDGPWVPTISYCRILPTTLQHVATMPGAQTVPDLSTQPWLRETAGEFIREPNHTAEDWTGLIEAPFGNHLGQQKPVRDLALQLHLGAGTQLAEKYTFVVGDDANNEHLARLLRPRQVATTDTIYSRGSRAVILTGKPHKSLLVPR